MFTLDDKLCGQLNTLDNKTNYTLWRSPVVMEIIEQQHTNHYTVSLWFLHNQSIMIFIMNNEISMRIGMFIIECMIMKMLQQRLNVCAKYAWEVVDSYELNIDSVCPFQSFVCRLNFNYPFMPKSLITQWHLLRI